MSQVAFPREARLLRPPQFRAVFAQGEKHVSRGFVLIAASSETTGPRLGLALAKRRIRHAVDRNRVKRIVRESFRYHQTEIGRFDVVVLARSHTDRMANADLFAQLTKLWSRIAASPPPHRTTRHADGASSREPGPPNDG